MPGEPTRLLAGERGKAESLDSVTALMDDLNAAREQKPGEPHG